MSDLVISEASDGDPKAAADRLEALAGIDVLESTHDAMSLAGALLVAGALPSNALADALHLGIAAENGVEFLLTWNCRHLANAIQRPIIERVCLEHELEPPIICTPEELVRGDNDVA